MNAPYLSIVIAGRNDNYGGDFIQRLQRSLDWNIGLLEKHGICAEIIFVNWNPTKENLALEALVKFPDGRKYVQVRIITVPSEVHAELIDPEIRKTVPVFEFIAKNAGIRRAKGSFILCTNADVLIHPSIFQSIAHKKLDKQHFYRANRLDFQEPLSYEGVRSLFNAGYVVSLKGFTYHFNAFVNKRLQYPFFRVFNTCRLGWEFWKRRHEKFCNGFKLSVTYDNAAYYAHCLNSGDFMLMHRDHWMVLKAYPEDTFVSTHTDSIFTIFAFARWKEHVFAAPVFHQEHQRRYSWDAIDHERPFRDAFDKFQRIAKMHLSSKEATDGMNGEHWGLATHDLAEIYYE